MKVRLKYIVVFLVILGCFTVGIQAENTEEEIIEFFEEEYISSVSSLSLDTDAVTGLLVEGLSDVHLAEYDEALDEYKLTVMVSGYGVTSENVRSIVIRMLETNPQLFYFQNRYGYSRHKETGVVSKIYFYLMNTPDEIDIQKAQINLAVDRLLEVVDENMSDVEIVLSIYDVLASTITYPNDDLLNNTLGPNVRNLVGAFVEQEAVCAGYADAFMYLMDLLGIECGYASSTRANHAWNVVKLDGQWYHVDVTFADPVYNNMGKSKHDYFLISYDSMISKDSRRTDTQISVKPDSVLTMATDTQYEQNHMWHMSDTMLDEHLGYWYFMDQQGNLVQYDSDTKNTVVIESGYSTDYSRGFSDGDSYYYTRPNGVYRYDYNDNTIEKVLSDINVYGVSMYNGVLAYSVGRGGSVEETVRLTGIDVIHSWNVLEDTEKKQVLKCSKCDETKTLMKTDLTQFTVQLSDDHFVYDGLKKVPVISLYKDSRKIRNDFYDVMITENINAGNASVLITGKGSYTGTIQTGFVIERASIESAEVLLNEYEIRKETEIKKPEVLKVVLNGLELVKDIDYTVSYPASTESVLVQGMNNYTGEVLIPYQIVEETGDGTAQNPLKTACEITKDSNDNILVCDSKVLDNAKTIWMYFIDETGKQIFFGVPVNLFQQGRMRLDKETTDQFNGNSVLPKGEYLLKMMIHYPDITNTWIEVTENTEFQQILSYTPDEINVAFTDSELIVECTTENEACVAYLDAMSNSLNATVQVFEAGENNQLKSFVTGSYKNSYTYVKEAKQILIPFSLFDKNLNVVNQDVIVMISRVNTYPQTANRRVDALNLNTSTTQDVFRISGQNRFSTSLNIAETLRETLNVERFDTVILASGRDFADALAGSVLAASKKAPILMVDTKNNIISEIKSYLDQRMNPEGKVIVLGGTGAVPAFVEDGLEGYTIERVYGKSRYETNIEILKKINSSNDEILICNGKNFADSLSASSTGVPLLLVGSALNDVQKAYLLENNFKKITILGGTGAVSETVEEQLKEICTDVTRISGKSRYETSVLVAQKYFTNPDTIVLTYAKNYPDGLSGGPLAYVFNAPVILTDSQNSTSAMNYVKSQRAETGFILGGSSLIDDTTIRKIYSLKQNKTIEMKGFTD